MSSQPQLTHSSHNVNISMQTSSHSSQNGDCKNSTDEFLSLSKQCRKCLH